VLVVSLLFVDIEPLFDWSAADELIIVVLELVLSSLSSDALGAGAGVDSTVTGVCVTVIVEPDFAGVTFTFVFVPTVAALPVPPAALLTYARPVLSTTAGPAGFVAEVSTGRISPEATPLELLSTAALWWAQALPRRSDAAKRAAVNLLCIVVLLSANNPGEQHACPFRR
jgi:hypothetical protein